MSRGIQRERQVRVLLEADGWVVVRAAGSLGCADLVALRAGDVARFVEVKSTAAGPYEHFGPAARQLLAAEASWAGAEAWLCWWPSRRKPVWIPCADWPGARA